MMNRELKFRIWDPKAGNWFWKPDELGNIIYCDDWDMFDPYDYQFDQFTGLKDKNGKEIYEGDIIYVYDVYAEVSYVDTVIWGGEDDYPAFDLKNHAMEYEANALSSIVNGGFETIEVIGNIHENPELLEEDK